MSLTIRRLVRHLIPLFFVFAFALVAIVFALLGITSSKWSQREYYDTPVPEDWSSPDLTVYRSPFSVCAANITTSQVNGSDGKPIAGPTTYDYVCARYKPSGAGRTSCELPSEIVKYMNLNDSSQDANLTRGDARLCQQIHYAGNFGIAGSLFVSLGSLLAVGLVLLGSLDILSSRSAGQVEGSSELRQRRHSKQKPFIAHANFTLIVFMIVGAVSTLISQFYGIIALTQSAPNNSDFASSSYGSSTSDNPDIAGNHGPWYQAEGLSVYMTLSWAFALATAALSAMLWRTPSWRLD